MDQGSGQSEGSGVESLPVASALMTALRGWKIGAIRLERAELPKMMCAGAIV